MAKRFFDIILAAILGILLLPVAVVIVILIRVESIGSVVYPSLRMGKDKRPFSLLRFRTMAGSPPQKTKFGRWIGNLSLDELPVLWNVLKGDMSFVVPRPEIPEKVDLADPDWQIILTVRPGMTGLGLLKYLDKYNETAVTERIQPDVYYAQHQSFLFDCQLLVKTISLWIRMGHLKGKIK
jgi:lipopolysaccharide/colanic/teichoic acid biosynthesis glycosyltransferase